MDLLFFSLFSGSAGESLHYLDRLSASKTSDYVLRLELGEGYARLGSILDAPVGSGDSLGKSTEGLAADRKALALLRIGCHHRSSGG